MYNVINSVAHKKRTWNVKVIVNVRVDNTTIFVVELIPNNVVQYVRKSTRYKDQIKLWYNICVVSLNNMNDRLDNCMSIISTLWSNYFLWWKLLSIYMFLYFILYYIICKKICHSFCHLLSHRPSLCYLSFIISFSNSTSSTLCLWKNCPSYCFICFNVFDYAFWNLIYNTMFFFVAYVSNLGYSTVKTFILYTIIYLRHT